MPWKAFDYRGEKVWVRVLDTGKPIVRRGLVEFRYKQGANKSYRSGRENFEDLDGEPEVLSDAEFGGQMTTPSTKLREEPSVPADANTIIIHTDGIHKNKRFSGFAQRRLVPAWGLPFS